MNTVVLIGNLTSDPVAKQTKSGTAMTTMRLAVNTGWGDNKQTAFLHIVTFGKRAETCAKYLAKGRKVCVRGSISTSEYTNDEGRKVYTTDIIADEVEFLSKAEDAGQRTQNDAPQDAPMQEDMLPPGFEAIDEEDQLPF